MEIIKTTDDLNIILNQEVAFQTNAGWEESLATYEDELLLKVLNPIDNFETVRYIHKPYDSNGLTQTDIWFYFYFIDDNNTYTNGLDYNLVGITSQENESMLKQSTESFFRLEFFKTPGTVANNVLTCEPPNRINRKLVFAKNLALPLGEKYFYSVLNGYVHLPVFQGSNYENKENMYFFWFADESVLTETNLSGSTTGNTFFMTAKFYNAKDGNIFDFTNSGLTSNYMLSGFTESNDMYYQVDINKTDYSYQIFSFNGTKGNRIGTTQSPIKFYEKGSAPIPIALSPTPTPSFTPTLTPTVTPTTGLLPSLTPTPTITLTPSSSGDGGIPSGAYLTIANDTTYSTDSNTNCNGAYNYTGQITVTLRNSGGTPINTPLDIIVTFEVSNSSCMYVASYQDTVTITTGSSFETRTYNSYGHEICPVDSNCSGYSNTWTYYANNRSLSIGI